MQLQFFFFLNFFCLCSYSFKFFRIFFFMQLQFFAEINYASVFCGRVTANGEVQKHEEAIVCVKELGIFLTMKVLENTPAVLSLGKLCDENGYSCEWINGQKPHLIKDGIRIICNTENFVPIVVPGLSSSSSGSSSTSRTPIKQESHSSSSSSSSPSSPTVGEMSVREREDAPNSDISPVRLSTLCPFMC